MRPLSKVLVALLCAFCLQLALDHLAGAANATSPPPEDGKASAVEQAHASLVKAKVYLDVEAYEQAQKEIIDALKAAPDEISLREEGIKLWREVDQAKQAGQKRKNMAQLDEAARLASEGKTTEAATKASQILEASNDPEVLAKAQGIVRNNRATLGGLLNVALRDLLTAVGATFGWAAAIIEAFVVLAILYICLWLARAARKKTLGKKKNSWWLGVIDDKTGSNVTDFVITSFKRWRDEKPSAAAGLLRLEALQLPSVPALEVAGPEFDMGAALESLKLQIGTVSVGNVAKAIGAVRGWFNALRPSISGAAFSRESQIVVHLIKRSANSDSDTVVANATTPEKAAESASFKMYYLIAKQTTVSDADLADKLRQGLGQLSQYISGQNPKQLQTAYETFRNVVREKPSYDEASLYEGVALDLMERHEEAISRFAYLARNADDPDLKNKAMYNEAVSRFRKYTPEDFDLAIEELEKVIGKESALEVLINAPVKALAYAAKANAIAHKFIFWQAILHKSSSKEESAIVERKQQSRKDIEAWLKEVNDMTALLEQVYTNAKTSESWDPLTRRQLKWAIQNARGNAQLNCAMSFYAPPEAAPDAAKLRSESLNKALEAFQECEVLLPAGVETLANLATTFLKLSKWEEARAYAKRAIELNPNYEYAYYRLAQSWEGENRKDETSKVLSSFPGAPRIPGFKEFFNRYYVEPKSA